MTGSWGIRCRGGGSVVNSCFVEGVPFCGILFPCQCEGTFAQVSAKFSLAVSELQIVFPMAQGFSQLTFTVLLKVVLNLVKDVGACASGEQSEQTQADG